MAKLISYPLSVVYYLFFGSCLVLFDVLQRICFVFSSKAHKASVVLLNFLLLRCLNILGTRFEFDVPFSLEKNQSYIFVANHQSTYDIPPLIWCLRKIHPKFVGKKELGMGIPSISFNLKNGGAVLIDRKKPKKALEQIRDFGKKLSINQESIIIFPEGTRSRTHHPKVFKYGGLKELIAVMPDAKLVGISISHSWKLSQYGSFPMGIGATMKLKVHPPIHVSNDTVLETLNELEKTIKASIEP